MSAAAQRRPGRVQTGGSEAVPPEAISRYLEAFIEMLIAERGAAANTVASYRRDLTDCARVLIGANDSPVAVLDSAGTDALRRYLKHLAARGMAPRTVARRVSALRMFYRFLHAEGHWLHIRVGDSLRPGARPLRA